METKLTDEELSRVLSDAEAEVLDYHNRNTCVAYAAMGPPPSWADGTKIAARRWWAISNACGDAIKDAPREDQLALERPASAAKALDLLRRAGLV